MFPPRIISRTCPLRLPSRFSPLLSFSFPPYSPHLPLYQLFLLLADHVSAGIGPATVFILQQKNCHFFRTPDSPNLQCRHSANGASCLSMPSSLRPSSVSPHPSHFPFYQFFELLVDHVSPGVGTAPGFIFSKKIAISLGLQTRRICNVGTRPTSLPA
jgi:hypothetical protein